MAAFTNVWVTPGLNNESKLSRTIHTGVNEEVCDLRDECLESLRAFHKDRTLRISAVDDHVLTLTKEDVQEALPFLEIDELKFTDNSKFARLTLKKPEFLDPLLSEISWPSIIKSQKIKIKLSSSENFLCISNLPEDLTSLEFQELVCKFGPAPNYFLLYKYSCGQNLNYGFVEYCSRAVACQAKNLLDKKGFRNRHLQCDWLNHKLISYCDLYSKCLFVYGLPLDFTELALLRQLTSIIASPLYCQIVMNQGKSLGIALVEYQNHEDAEKTRTTFNSNQMHSSLRMGYAQPGNSAVKIYESLMRNIAADNQTIKQVSLPSILPTMPLSVSSFNILPVLQNLYNIQQQFKTRGLNSDRELLGKFEDACSSRYISSSLIPGMMKVETDAGNSNTREINSSSITSIPIEIKPHHEIPVAHDTSLKPLLEFSEKVCKTEFGDNEDVPPLIYRDIKCEMSPPKGTSPCNLKWPSPALTTPPSWKRFKFIDVTPTLRRQTDKDCSPSVLKGFEEVKIESPNITNDENMAPSSNGETPKKGLATEELEGSGKRPVNQGTTWAQWSPSEWSSSEANLARGIMSAAWLWNENSQESAPTPIDSPEICRTPNSLKRKPLSTIGVLLPQPEPSPVNGYVGQHSQGIGGHYAESYRLKKRKLI